MVQVANGVAVDQDSALGGRVRGPLEWDKAMVVGLAEEEGVCARARWHAGWWTG